MSDKASPIPTILNVSAVLDGKFMMDELDEMSMEEATWLTVHALHKDLDGADIAAAKLSLLVADRIDRDGQECGVSLYTRLHYLLMDLKHKDESAQDTASAKEEHHASC